MLIEAEILEALGVIALVGGVAGLVGGFFAGARSLIGTVLVGIIGAISVAAVFRFGDAPPIYAVGNGFSVVWGGLGGLILSYVVGRSA